jgi:hypothetical protein
VKSEWKKKLPAWFWICFWMGIGSLIIAFLYYLCYRLWLLSHQQHWSGEVDAAIINTFAGVLTLAVTVGVTAFFNIKTQRITIDQNQKNIELQMKLHQQNLEMQERINKQNIELQQKMQEMNYEALMFQARSSMRDILLEKRVNIYTEIYKNIVDLNYVLANLDEKTVISHDQIIKEFIRIYSKICDMQYNNRFWISKTIYKYISEYRKYIFGDERLEPITSKEKIVLYPNYREQLLRYSRRILNQIRLELSVEEIEKDLLSLRNEDIFIEDLGGKDKNPNLKNYIKRVFKNNRI